MDYVDGFELCFSVRRLIESCFSVHDKRNFLWGLEMLESNECEMALEDAVLEMSKAHVYPDEFDPSEWRRVARLCGLDEGGVLRHDIWLVMERWIEGRP